MTQNTCHYNSSAYKSSTLGSRRKPNNGCNLAFSRNQGHAFLKKKKVK